MLFRTDPWLKAQRQQEELQTVKREHQQDRQELDHIKLQLRELLKQH